MANELRKFKPLLTKSSKRPNAKYSFNFEKSKKIISSIIDFIKSNSTQLYNDGATKIFFQLTFESNFVSKTNDPSHSFSKIYINYYTSSLSLSSGKYELVKTYSFNSCNISNIIEELEKNLSFINEILKDESIPNVVKLSNPKNKELSSAYETQLNLIKEIVDDNFSLNFISKLKEIKDIFNFIIPGDDLNDNENYIIQLQSNSKKTIELINESKIINENDFIYMVDGTVAKILAEKKFIIELAKEHTFQNSTLNSISMGNLSLDFDENVNKINKSIGVIDTAPSEDFDQSNFNELIRIRDLGMEIDGFNWMSKPDIENEFSHGEAVASLYSFGDAMNDYDDGCGKLYCDLYPAITKGVLPIELYKRIDKIVDKTENDIYVITTSVGVMNDLKIGVSEFGQNLDKISKAQKDKGRTIKFIVCGTNNDKSFDFSNLDENTMNLPPFITGPADSIKSFTVNSVMNFKDEVPASYSRKGINNFITLKPDVSYFGGDSESNSKIFTQIGGKKHVLIAGGTSFSTPLLARLYATLFYKYDFNFLEIEALLINNAIVNQFGRDRQPNILHGNGVPQNNIDELINYSSDKYVLLASHQTNEWIEEEISFPILTDEFNKNKNDLIITLVSDSLIDHSFGVEAVRNSVVPNLISKKMFKHGKSSNELRSPIIFEGTEKTLNNALFDEDLIKYYGKWKTKHSIRVRPQEDTGRPIKENDKIKITFTRDSRTGIEKEKVQYAFVISILSKEEIDAEGYDKKIKEISWVQEKIVEVEQEKEKI